MNFIFLCRHMESSRNTGPVSHILLLMHVIRYLHLYTKRTRNAEVMYFDICPVLMPPFPKPPNSTVECYGPCFSLVKYRVLILYPKAGHLEIFGGFPQSFPANALLSSGRPRMLPLSLSQFAIRSRLPIRCHMIWVVQKASLSKPRNNLVNHLTQGFSNFVTPLPPKIMRTSTRHPMSVGHRYVQRSNCCRSLPGCR
jgi:hypothetical protein